MTRRHLIASHIGTPRSLESYLKASVEMHAAGRVVPKHELPTDEQLAQVNAALDRLLRGPVWLVTDKDMHEDVEALLR